MKVFLASVAFFFSAALSAQITDSFSDGDFTNSPTWAGDNADYLVNGAFQLQLNGTVADTSYLSFASPFISNAEWQFWIKLSFAPSDNNNARVYLVSDVANLQGPVNGYYVRLGENGSFDSVDLWEQTGTTSTKIIDGVNAHCAASTNTLRIRVTRNASGLWNLYSDTLGGVNFQPEGSITDNTHTSCNYFGVYSKYTVSNINKFYYDDIYAGPIIVDVTAPTLVSATPLSSTQLDVLFNENVDLATSQVLTNYSVNNSIGNPSAAVRDGSNASLVHLTFATPFTSGLPNTLTVTNVQDASANAISSATASFTWFSLGTAVYHDVLINEIMADPSPVVALPNTEFIELYNRSSGNFDLTGWTFSDGSTTSTLGTRVIGAGQYLILCANADTQLFSPLGPVLGLSTFPSLNNTGDVLYLRDDSNVLIDSVNFDISWYQDPNKDDGGWTLELINPNAGNGCAASGNWIASNAAAGGTPGTQNSVYNNSPDITGPSILTAFAPDALHIEICFSEAIDPVQFALLSSYSLPISLGSTPAALVYDTATLRCVTLTLSTPMTNNTSYIIVCSGLTDCAGNALVPNAAICYYHIIEAGDVVISEIMADPDPPLSLPNEEYLEVRNTTPYPLSLEGWSLTTGSTQRVIPAAIIWPDSCLVLTSTAAAPAFTVPNVVGVTSFSALTNTGATLTLRDPAGLMVHTLTYSDSWYRDAAKADGGWSIEMIDPSNPCAGMENWHASLHPSGGTPGTRNSVYASNPDQAPPQLLRVSLVNVDTIRAWFSESLDSTAMANIAAYAIDNSMGQPIAAIPEGPAFKTVKLRLPSTLQPAVIYTLTANTALSDCAGNPLSSSSARFALPLNVSPNDVVINEILPDPKTGGVDYVEIYNRSNKVIDLQKMYLCTLDTLTGIFEELNVIAPEGYLFFPQDYLLLSEDGAAVKTQYSTENPNAFLDMNNIPTMNIDGDIVVLIDTSGLIIDKLVYSSSWHYPLLQDTKGVSLERIDFDRTTQDMTNWHSAAEQAGFGTPGYKNSQFSQGGADDGAVTVPLEVFSPDNDGSNDVVNINYHFDRPGFTANVRIYDARGRLVRTLVKNELLGTEQGTFSWDGIDDAREKSRIGLYVIYFEAFNTAGEVKKYKRQCVLASKL